VTDERTGPSCRAITFTDPDRCLRSRADHLTAGIRRGSSPAQARTRGNVTGQGGVRLGLGPTRDVVMIDSELEHAYSLEEVPAGLARGYAAQAGWDPRESGESMRFLVLRPLRIQAWREADELPGRTLMRGGAWIP
jgi:hypothetical protein